MQGQFNFPLHVSSTFRIVFVLDFRWNAFYEVDKRHLKQFNCFVHDIRLTKLNHVFRFKLHLMLSFGLKVEDSVLSNNISVPQTCKRLIKKNPLIIYWLFLLKWNFFTNAKMNWIKRCNKTLQLTSLAVDLARSQACLFRKPVYVL